MFVYEKGNTLNVVFNENRPVETPDLVIKGYVNGVSISLDGQEVVSVENPVEFENKADLRVFEKNNVLNMTYHGVEGMNNPEVTLNEEELGKVVITANGKVITVSYDANDVVLDNEEEPVVDNNIAPVEEPISGEEDVTEQTENEVEPEAVTE